MADSARTRASFAWNQPDAHHPTDQASQRPSAQVAIINPAMIATWALGLWLAWSVGWWASGWFHAKLALVLALSAIHGLFAKWVKDFAADRNRRPAKFYRWVNELPTILMIGIVILVIVKPF